MSLVQKALQFFITTLFIVFLASSGQTVFRSFSWRVVIISTCCSWSVFSFFASSTSSPLYRNLRWLGTSNHQNGWDPILVLSSSWCFAPRSFHSSKLRDLFVSALWGSISALYWIVSPVLAAPVASKQHHCSVVGECEGGLFCFSR